MTFFLALALAGHLVLAAALTDVATGGGDSVLAIAASASAERAVLSLFPALSQRTAVTAGDATVLNARRVFLDWLPLSTDPRHQPTSAKCYIVHGPDSAMARVALLLSYGTYPGGCGVGTGLQTSDQTTFDCYWCKQATRAVCEGRFDLFRQMQSDASYMNEEPFVQASVWPLTTGAPPRNCSVQLVGVAGGACRMDYATVTLALRVNQIQLAFRGTANLAGWVSDVGGGLPKWLSDMASQRSAAPFIRNKTVHIHSGFLDGYMSVRAGVLEQLARARRACPRCTLLITGHSRGGALASIAAADVATLRLFPAMDVITFGSPRVGNAQFSRYMLDLTCTRGGPIQSLSHHVNNRDPVPLVPLLLDGFYHAGTMVRRFLSHVPGLMEVSSFPWYYICAPEDPNCGVNGKFFKDFVHAQKEWALQLIMAYHVTYLGVDGNTCASRYSCVSCDNLKSLAGPKGLVTSLIGRTLFTPTSGRVTVQAVDTRTCKVVVRFDNGSRAFMEGSALRTSAPARIAGWLAHLTPGAFAESAHSFSCEVLRRLLDAKPNLVGRSAQTRMLRGRVTIVAVDAFKCALQVRASASAAAKWIEAGRLLPDTVV